MSVTLFACWLQRDNAESFLEHRYRVINFTFSCRLGLLNPILLAVRDAVSTII